MPWCFESKRVKKRAKQEKKEVEKNRCNIKAKSYKCVACIGRGSVSVCMCV